MRRVPLSINTRTSQQVRSFYPHGSGALGFDKINPGVPTLPETLRESGYYTAAIGKAVHTIPSRHKTAFDETYDMHELGYGRSPKRYRETTSGAIEDTGWGYTRILGELKKLGINSVTRNTVKNILKRNG